MAIKDRLTPKQSYFVTEYLVDFNATQAAIRAGYTKRTAESTGSRLLSNHKVQRALEKAREAQQHRVEVRSDDVLRGFLNIADVDIADMFDENGFMKPIHEIPENIRKAIAGIETVEEIGGESGDRRPVATIRKIRLNDRLKALENLGRHLGIYNADESQKPQVNLLALLLERIDGSGVPCIKSNQPEVLEIKKTEGLP